MRFAGLVAAVALLLLDCGAWPAGFRLDAELLDGRMVSGLIDARLLPLTLFVGAGQTADVALAPSSEVEWLAPRGVFRIRSIDFTAEALGIEPPLEIRDRSGKQTSLSWRDIRRVRISPR